METEQIYSDKMWLGWMDQLAEKEYVVVDDFIDEGHFRQIMSFFQEKERNNELKKAGIGTSGEFQVQSEIRGDFIYWLDRYVDSEMAPFFTVMDELMANLRRFCYLSLSDSEFHIAKYPKGSHYHKHLDQFHERTNRQITVLIYLNENWKPGDGGELKIYRKEGDLLIEPIARRLLLFRSDSVEHEVLTTNVPRYSLTGWLLHRPQSVNLLF